jgi:hypothetical protein
MKSLKIAALAALVALFSTAALAQLLTPQGRLSLSSTQAVMTSDVTGAGTIYYDAYVGTLVPSTLSNTNTWVNNQSAALPLTLTLTSSQTSGNIYDIFLFINANNALETLGLGPAWSNSTSRGTGAGTTEIKRDATQGFWVNANAFTPVNGVTSFQNVPVGRATYLGSVYMTANGQTSVQLKPTPASGGTGNVIGIWNAYNRVPVDTISRDDEASYSYASGTWREMGGNTNTNYIQWLDGAPGGQGQTSVNASVKTMVGASTATDQMNIGVALDSDTGTPNIYATANAPTSTIGDNYQTIFSEESFPPQSGIHTMYAMEEAGSSVSGTFYPNGIQTLHLRLDY